MRPGANAAAILRLNVDWAVTITDHIPLHWWQRLRAGPRELRVGEWVGIPDNSTMHVSYLGRVINTSPHGIVVEEFSRGETAWHTRATAAVHDASRLHRVHIDDDRHGV